MSKLLGYLCYGLMAAGILVMALGDFLIGGGLLAAGILMHFSVGH